MSNRSRRNTAVDPLEHLIALITDLKEEESLKELKALIESGVDPKALFQCCMEGMRRVGVLFEKGVYYIAALIMAGEIMRVATALLTPHLSIAKVAETGGGCVMLGTIQGDIHDLGKNLFSLLLQCNGIKVIDLGVDIAGEVFFAEAAKNQPDIIGISCVLTNNVEHLKQAVHDLQSGFPNQRPPIIIGGTCLDERIAEYVGATYWAKDAAAGLRICEKFFSEKNNDHR